MMNEKMIAGIKVHGKVMREFNNNIFIPFGTDYSIFLKNLNSQKASLKIEIDGNDILDGNSIILGPNEELDLERWLVGGLYNGPKLKFIEKTNELREIRDDKILDGIVKITYQFEKRVSCFNDFYGVIRSPSVFYTSQQYQGPPEHDQTIKACSAISKSQGSFDNEDGITIKGDESHQQFQEAYIGILEYEEHVICFNLKGGFKKEIIREPITVKTKIICDCCLTKNKSNYKFCFKCGNNLKYSSVK